MVSDIIHIRFLSFTLQDGLTPLYVASQEGHTDVVDTLVKAGADLCPKVHANYVFLLYHQ